MLRRGGGTGETIDRYPAQRGVERGPDLEQRRNGGGGFRGGERGYRFAAERFTATRRELTKDIHASRTGFAQGPKGGKFSFGTGSRSSRRRDQLVFEPAQAKAGR